MQPPELEYIARVAWWSPLAIFLLLLCGWEKQRVLNWSIEHCVTYRARVKGRP